MDVRGYEAARNHALQVQVRPGLEIKLTVGEAMTYWLESRGSSSKHSDRATCAFDRVRLVLGQVQVRRLTPADMIAFKRTLLEPDDPDRRPLAPTTVNIVLRYLRPSGLC